MSRSPTNVTLSDDSQGTHNAMKSGMLAAEATVEKLLDESADKSKPIVLQNYRDKLESSDVWTELKKVRNIRPAFATPLGKLGGVLYAGIDEFIMKGREPWTLKLKHADNETLKPASECTEIEYPKPDGKLSFDLLTNLARTNTYHDDDQPAHLRVQNWDKVLPVNYEKYAGPEQRFCPAGVYEYVDDAKTGGKKLQINAQNCIHCKTCSIKWADPEGLRWTVPSSGGPAYEGM